MGWWPLALAHPRLLIQRGRAGIVQLSPTCPQTRLRPLTQTGPLSLKSIRLKVAVNDLPSVRDLDGADNLADDGEGTGHRHRTFLQQRAQLLTVDILHDQKESAVIGAAEVVGGGDVLMLQVAGDQGLALEARKHLRDLQEARMQHLHRHALANGDMVDKVDRRHGADPEQGLDFIAAGDDLADELVGYLEINGRREGL